MRGAERGGGGVGELCGYGGSVLGVGVGAAAGSGGGVSFGVL